MLLIYFCSLYITTNTATIKNTYISFCSLYITTITTNTATILTLIIYFCSLYITTNTATIKNTKTLDNIFAPYILLLIYTNTATIKNTTFVLLIYYNQHGHNQKHFKNTLIIYFLLLIYYNQHGHNQKHLLIIYFCSLYITTNTATIKNTYW